MAIAEHSGRCPATDRIMSHRPGRGLGLGPSGRMVMLGLENGTQIRSEDGKPGIVAQTCNSSTGETEAQRFKGQPGLHGGLSQREQTRRDSRAVSCIRNAERLWRKLEILDSRAEQLLTQLPQGAFAESGRIV